mgnify:CR=1 FL=1
MLLPIEAVEEIKALAEKKAVDHKEQKEQESGPEPEPVLSQKNPKPVLPPRRTSTRTTKIDEKTELRDYEKA